MTVESEDLGKELELCKAGAPSTKTLAEMAEMDRKILDTELIFKPNDHLLEDMVKQAQARVLQKPL